MGLLALGTPLPWSEAKKHADYVRDHGIEQLLHIWHNLKDRTGDRLLWGDEVSSPFLPPPPLLPFLPYPREDRLLQSRIGAGLDLVGWGLDFWRRESRGAESRGRWRESTSEGSRPKVEGIEVVEGGREWGKPLC